MIGFERLVAAAAAVGLRGWWCFMTSARWVGQLRAVAWQVPDFSVERYEEALRRIDRGIRESGEFRVRSHRF